MYDIFLFAGTTEGRQIASYLSRRNQDKSSRKPLRTIVFTATAYGGSLVEGDGITVHEGRLTAGQMADYFLEHRNENAEKPSVVIDATHPYAAEVSRNIQEACRQSRLRCIRVLRESGFSPAPGDILVKSPEEAAGFLENTTGNILLTTGSKELPVFAGREKLKERIFARVLPLSGVVKASEALGIRGQQLLCMQGPFSEEMNIALIHHTNAKYLVTKETGTEGGFPEKMAAAAKTGITPVIILRPVTEVGIRAEECIERLDRNNL